MFEIKNTGALEEPIAKVTSTREQEKRAERAPEHTSSSAQALGNRPRRATSRVYILCTSAARLPLSIHLGSSPSQVLGATLGEIT